MEELVYILCSSNRYILVPSAGREIYPKHGEGNWLDLPHSWIEYWDKLSDRFASLNHRRLLPHGVPTRQCTIHSFFAPSPRALSAQSPLNPPILAAPASTDYQT